MINNNTYNYLLSDLKKLKGIGIKTSNLLKKKKIKLLIIRFKKIKRNRNKNI